MNSTRRALAHAKERTIETILENVGYRRARLLEVELMKRLKKDEIELANRQQNIRKDKLAQYTKEQFEWARKTAAELWP